MTLQVQNSFGKFCTHCLHCQGVAGGEALLTEICLTVSFQKTLHLLLFCMHEICVALWYASGVFYCSFLWTSCRENLAIKIKCSVIKFLLYHSYI